MTMNADLAPVAARPAPPGISPAGRRRYAALLEVMQQRATARAFDPTQAVDEEAYRLILEAARLSPSGANAQPWHFVVVTSPWTRRVIADYVATAQARQSAAASPDAALARAMAEAPGCIVVVTDFRLTWAYPGLMEGTELDQRYHANAERVILQSVAGATAAAHLAAAALGFQSWWVSVLGQDEVQAAMHPLLGVPPDLSITDIMLFGRPLRLGPKRWKKRVDEIASWDRFDMANFRSLAQIDAWMEDVRARAAVSLPSAR
jgi:5,6-dimethylbenzimidazole synthase